MTTSEDFHALFEASPNAYMVCDRALRFVAANAAYCRAVDVADFSALAGRPVFEAFPDDPNRGSRARVEQSIRRAFASGVVDVVAFVPYRVGNHVTRYWSATHTPIKDAAGAVERVMQHTVDVTELHQGAGASAEQMHAGVLQRARGAERAGELLSDEMRRLLQVFEQAPPFVAVMRGPHHTFALTNAAYRQLVGHRDLVGRRVAEAMPEVVEQGFVALLDGVYRTGTPYVGSAVGVKLQRGPNAPPHDRLVDFTYQPMVDADGTITGILVIGVDVTETRADLNDVRALAEAIPVQVWSATPDGLLDFVNSGATAYFGEAASALVGAGWTRHVHPDDLPDAARRWTAALASGETYETQFRLQRGHDQQWRWHLARALPMRDVGGTIIKWYGTNTDVDDAARAREELERRSLFEEQLIGIVSHDLRNPLSAITLSAATLLRGGNLDAKQGRAVARITTAAERALRMIRDLLDFSLLRAQGQLPVTPSSADIARIVTDTVDELRVAHAERIVTIEHSGPVDVDVDADRFAQVVGNLVANALQHSPSGAAVVVRSSVDDKTARFTVQNGGPPIADRDLPRLFQPFQRGEGAVAGGRSVGLGLHIAERIVAAHGGTITVSTNAEDGTTFTVSIPRRHPPASADDASR